MKFILDFLVGRNLRGFNRDERYEGFELLVWRDHRLRYHFWKQLVH